MKYQIEIKGMHCMGCSNLIKISLEEAGLVNVDVNIDKNTAIFESNLNDIHKIKLILNKIFKELPSYSYDNIKMI
jgi:copper chaperone CopZ